jgi:hypothetical protein
MLLRRLCSSWFVVVIFITNPPTTKAPPSRDVDKEKSGTLPPRATEMSLSPAGAEEVASTEQHLGRDLVDEPFVNEHGEQWLFDASKASDQRQSLIPSFFSYLSFLFSPLQAPVVVCFFLFSHLC